MQLQEWVQVTIELIQKVQHIYKILLDMPRFTSDLQAQINQIHAEMKRSRNIISQLVGSSIDNYNNLLNVQGTLADL